METTRIELVTPILRRSAAALALVPVLLIGSTELFGEKKLVEAEGIEPSFPACKTGVLPLNYTPVVLGLGIAPRSPGLQPGAILPKLSQRP